MLILTKSIIALILGLISSFILGIIIVPFFQKIHVGQNVSKLINERHLSKEGTPTMGGFIFIISTLIIILFLFINKSLTLNANFCLIIFTFISYMLLGFTDDFYKIKFKNNKGLSILNKFLFEIVIAIIFFTIYITNGNSTIISILKFNIDLKYLYGFFILFLLTGSSNAVNITDGLDGLCAGCAVISFLTYGILAWNYNYIIGNEEIAIFCFTLVGSLLGFLFFNFYPAKIFMGDLGSLALGSTLASIAIILKCELSLCFVGIVYILETLSSIIQIISIRIFNRKIFRKSPLHHHFEEYNIHESDIIKGFYIVSFIFALIAIIYYVWI